MEKYDLIIVGAGPAGIFTAVELLRHGSKKKILLVEKWASEERQQTHLRQPHMQQLKRWKEQYIAETTVEKI